jgi:CheY-like chemotaxis protein
LRTAAHISPMAGFLSRSIGTFVLRVTSSPVPGAGADPGSLVPAHKRTLVSCAAAERCVSFSFEACIRVRAQGSGVMAACAEPLKVLLVDDHEHVLWGLGKLLEGEWPRMIVVATARTMSDAIAAVHRHAPAVVVLDIVLGTEISIEHIPDLIVNGPQVLILTGRRDPELHRRALAAGACAIVLKDEPAEMLLREIEKAGSSVMQHAS